MRVLHIGKYFPPYRGGMETYLRDLMLAQAEQGIECSALVHRSEASLGNTSEVIEKSGSTLTVERAATWFRLLFTPVSPGFPWLLAAMIRRHQPDILHLHLPNLSATWALFLPSARNIPWVIHWHSDIPLSAQSLGLRVFYRLYKPFERALLARSGTIIVTSPPYLQTSAPLAPFKSKCRVVPLGLKPRGISAEPTGTEKPLKILAVGRLTYYKGFEYLLRALALCENATLDLVGAGDGELSLKAISHELGLDQRVVFHGELPDEKLGLMYRDCHCLCLPSIERTEAFGMVLLEAMEYGRASLITQVRGSGMTWVIDDGVTGLHAPVSDAQGLAEKIHQFTEQRDKLQAMGLAARCKFEREFRIEQSAEQITEIYRDGLGKSPQ